MNRILSTLIFSSALFLGVVASTNAQLVPTSPVAAPPAAKSDTVSLPKISHVVRNRDFFVLAEPQRASPGRTEVLVFFWYGSPWISKVDPLIRDWIESGKAPGNIRLQYVPLVLDQSWSFAARIFYAFEVMGIETTTTPKLLRAVERNAVNLTSPISVKRWVGEQGISVEKFEEAINSDLVVAKVAALPRISRTYYARSSPTFVIDGTYHIGASNQMTPEKATAVMMFMSKKLSEGGPRP